METIMFIVGVVIFSLYMTGLLTMINRSHKDQEKEMKQRMKNTMKYDNIDMDGMGNFSRFPPMGRRVSLKNRKKTTV